MAQNAAGLQVLELLEHIVGFLDDDPQTLRSCASASRLLVSAAQSYLFRTITCSILASSRYMSPERLATILSHSPHLATHIRCIAVAIDREGTMQLTRLALPNLTHLILHTDVEIMDRAITVGVHFIGLPSVRSVTVANIGATLTDLSQLFGECTPNLREVAFPGCGLKSATRNHDDLRAGLGRLPRIVGVRTQPASLVLTDSWRVVEWLLDKDCPIDLSQLTSVDAREMLPRNGHLNTLLENARLTLRHLKISMGEFIQFFKYWGLQSAQTISTEAPASV